MNDPALAAHSLHRAIRSRADLAHFMSRHVVCVWDFMTLLKSLQRDLTGIELPWLPAADPELTRLVNEIVLDEESDLLPDGRVLSHFAWYLEAMTEVGADLGPIDRFVAGLRAGQGASAALAAAGFAPEARDFVATTLSFLAAPTAVRAAVFLHGREELIPALFLDLAERLGTRGLRAPMLVSYLERHVEADRDDHGPRARRLLERLIAAEPALATTARAAAEQALAARRRLWDAILAGLPSRTGVETPQSA